MASKALIGGVVAEPTITAVGILLREAQPMKLIPNYCQHPLYREPGLHLLYTADRNRLAPFERAIQQVVHSGMVVADIGTGSGPLARFAAVAGAIKVYGVEQYQEILRFAERINLTEGMDRIIEPVCGDSRNIALPERVDVIVAELIASLGNDEALSNILEDARRRFLKPGGKMIPRGVEVFICPIAAPEAHRSIPTVYRDDIIVSGDSGFSPFRTYYQLFGLPTERLLGDVQLLDSIDLMGHTELSYAREFSFVCTAEGIFSGFAAWFKAALTEDIALDTSPWALPTCWGQAFFAVRHQVQVRKGDIVELTFSACVPSKSDRPFYEWQGCVRRDKQVLRNFMEMSEPPNGCAIPRAASSQNTGEVDAEVHDRVF
jgi:type I protein arginine methyltransferase